MADGFNVVTEQIRAHARNVEAIRDRFGAVKAASSHITQNNEAYGLLCQWMAAATEAAGTLVRFTRDIVRDLIADLVARCIV